MHDIQAVVFDLDGTLYAHWKVRLRLLPFVVRNIRFIRAFSKVRKHIRHIRHNTPVPNFRLQQATMLATYLNCTVEQAQEKIDELLLKRMPEALKHITPFRDVVPVLDWLQEHNIPMAVLSDFPIGNKLEYLNIGKYWSVTRCTGDSGYLKPHAEPFIDICTRLGVEPGKVLYVGDSYNYDVQGANAVGMMSAHLYRLKNIKRTGATTQFSCYSSFMSWLEHSSCLTSKMQVQG